VEAEEVKRRLNNFADRLVFVAGELMRRACSDPDEHLEGCRCNTCRAFLDTQAIQNEMEQLVRDL
jgi:predicted anti-sigma-YlaC factor YlaD